ARVPAGTSLVEGTMHLRVGSGRVGMRSRRVGETHQIPRANAGGFHPPCNGRTGRLELTLNHRRRRILIPALAVLGLFSAMAPVRAQPPEPVDVEGQPLAANVERVARALESLGAPLPGELTAELARAGADRDASALQRRLDPRVLLAVT